MRRSASIASHRRLWKRGTMHRAVPVALLALCFVANAARATELVCPVTKQGGESGFASDEHLAKWKPSVRILETGKTAKLARCGYSAVDDKETCDWYEVDRVEIDRQVGHRKYYVFRAQFDVQVFAGKERSFIENNGRGGIAWGACAPAPKTTQM